MVAFSGDSGRRVIKFIEHQNYNDFLGFKKALTKETELVKDLKITGDDAVEFLDSFIKHFSLKVGDFDFHDYFEEEGLWLLPRFKKTKEKRRITLGMLMRAVENGVWDSAHLSDSADDVAR